jgi:hypothetical protein
MKIIEGTVGNIGGGIWTTKAGGWTFRSVLEIGDHHLRKIGISDYLETYINPGAQVRILIFKRFATNPLVFAVEVNGKKYKEPALKILIAYFFLNCLFLVPLIAVLLLVPLFIHLAEGGSASPPDSMSTALACIPFVFAPVAWIWLVVFYIRSYIDYLRF